jgi:DNA-directed RNA polymerase subunit RPC12/RpoP
MAYKCKKCGKFVAKNATVCKHCGQKNPAELVEHQVNAKHKNAYQNIFPLNQTDNISLIQCPNCGNQLIMPEKFRNDYYLRCNICQKDFANPLNPVGKSENWLKKDGFKWGCLIIVIITMLAAIFVPSDFSSVPIVGDEIMIATDTFGAVDEQAFDEMEDAIKANDKIGLLQLMYDNRVEHLKSGTSAIIIKHTMGKVRIRLSNGHALWVKFSSIKK